MARFQDTDEAEDGKDVAGHRKSSDNDELAPIGGATPRQPKLDADDDDTEGHGLGIGPSTQGELMPRVPTDNPHGDR